VTATGFATPTNITSATGIVLSGVTHTGAIIPRVALVDTTTTNTDMVSGFATQTSLDSKLSASRLAVLTSLDAMIATNVYTVASLQNAPSGTGGDATEAKQDAIITAINGTEVIQVASPNVSGSLVLTQGDTYDGVGNPLAAWIVSTDYTDGWTVTLTIRDSLDAVVYTVAGVVASATSITVAITAPTGLTMTGCPGQWQGKFDVQLTKGASIQTVAIGTAYINEDQTR